VVSTCARRFRAIYKAREVIQQGIRAETVAKQLLSKQLVKMISFKNRGWSDTSKERRVQARFKLRHLLFESHPAQQVAYPVGNRCVGVAVEWRLDRLRCSGAGAESAYETEDNDVTFGRGSVPCLSN